MISITFKIEEAGTFDKVAVHCEDSIEARCVAGYVIGLRKVSNVRMNLCGRFAKGTKHYTKDEFFSRY